MKRRAKKRKCVGDSPKSPDLHTCPKHSQPFIMIQGLDITAQCIHRRVVKSSMEEKRESDVVVNSVTFSKWTQSQIREKSDGI